MLHGLITRCVSVRVCMRHPGLKLSIPPYLFCMSRCPDFEFRGTRQGFLPGRIVQFLMNLHTKPRTIYLSRSSGRPETTALRSSSSHFAAQSHGPKCLPSPASSCARRSDARAALLGTASRSTTS